MTDKGSIPLEGEKHYFDNWETIEAIFAGSLARNLKEAERRLRVQFVARDSWIKIVSPDTALAAKAAAFLKELVKVLNGSSQKSIDQRDFEQMLSAFQGERENELQLYFSEKIKVSPKKRDIVPRTRNQLEYVRGMRERDIVFGIGPAGTGKTYLAMAMAVSELLSGKYNRIVLTRPAVEAGESLGFLPGSIEEKVNPYLRPLYDALYDMLEFAEAGSLIERNIIEVAPLAFMRGRTLNNAFIILDEAQNATPDQMLMFLTRLGFNSQCVVAGDPSQTDLAGRRSGLAHAIRTLSPIEEIKICKFTSRDVVRHSLVEKIVNAYQSASGKPEDREGG